MVGMVYSAVVRIAVLLVALTSIAVGALGLVSPDSVTAVRRLYFATPAGLWTAGVVRLAMGLVLIMSGPASRAPKTLRVLGAVMLMQVLSAALSDLIARERSSNGRRCTRASCASGPWWHSRPAASWCLR